MKLDFSTRTFLDALAYLPPEDLTYAEWLHVGIALYNEGYNCEVWDSWSSKDTDRYKEGECSKKWETFHSYDEEGVTCATIFSLAEKAGWKFPKGDALNWDSAIIDTSGDKGDDIMSSPGIAADDVTTLSPVAQAKAFIEALYEPDDYVHYTIKAYMDKGKWRPKKGICSRTAAQLVTSLDKYPDDLGATFGDSNPEAGIWIQYNPCDGKGAKQENVTDFRYMLLESDTMNKDDFIAFVKNHNLPVLLMVDSAGRSIHAIIRVDASGLPEYKKRVRMVFDFCTREGIDIDTANANPNRLTRLPGAMRGGKRQHIVCMKAGAKSWDEWVCSINEGELSNSSSDHSGEIDSNGEKLPPIEPLDKYINDLPPKPEALIEGILRVGHKLIFAGISKCGKSIALMELCIAIASGTTWFGFECKKGRVLYVNFEIDGISALHRFHEIYNALGLSTESTKNISIWNLRGKSRPLEELAPILIENIKDKSIDAVVLDPLYKMLAGDENSSADVIKLCNGIDKICSEVGCAVIFCHHHSKGAGGYRRSMDRASGSGVFARDPDAILNIDELQQKNDQQKEQQAQQATKDKTTAWRMEATLREFPEIDPVDFYFKYPIHILDQVGELKKLKTAGSRNGSRSGSSSKGDKKAKFDQAFDFFNTHGSVTVKQMSERLQTSERTIRNRLKDYKDEYWCKNGFIGKYDGQN